MILATSYSSEIACSRIIKRTSDSWDDSYAFWEDRIARRDLLLIFSAQGQRDYLCYLVTVYKRRKILHKVDRVALLAFLNLETLLIDCRGGNCGDERRRESTSKNTELGIDDDSLEEVGDVSVDHT